MTNDRALVTVYITTHNRSELLPRAIDSVLAQDYRPLEIIVVDDASTDDTQTVLEQYRSRISSAESKQALQFSAIVLNENSGACAARNAAIERAQGQYITGLDDDDEFIGQRISGLVVAWDEHFAALCTAKEVDHGGGKTSYLAKNVGPIKLEQLLNKNMVGSQVFTLTERLRAVGGFDVKFPAWQDYETWIRLALAYGDILKLAEVTYRVHTAHDKPRITSHEKSLQAIKLLREKHGHRLTPHHQRQLLYRELTAGKTSYQRLGPWLPAMTWRTFPQIIKRWLRSQFGKHSEQGS